VEEFCASVGEGGAPCGEGDEDAEAGWFGGLEDERAEADPGVAPLMFLPMPGMKQRARRTTETARMVRAWVFQRR